MWGQSTYGTWDMEQPSDGMGQKIFCILLCYASFVSRVASRSSVGLHRKERLQEVDMDTLDIIRAVNGSTRNFTEKIPNFTSV